MIGTCSIEDLKEGHLAFLTDLKLLDRIRGAGAFVYVPRGFLSTPAADRLPIHNAYLERDDPLREFAEYHNEFHRNERWDATPVLGKDCRIDVTARVGQRGFKVVPGDPPLLLKHIGGVRIGDRVEIGAYTCVVRGTFGDTIIEDDVKMDNLIECAHNVRIRAGAFIYPSAVLCGSSDIGQGAHIGVNATVHPGVKIGARAIVGAGAVVTHDVPEGVTVVGVPARPIERLCT